MSLKCVANESGIGVDNGGPDEVAGLKAAGFDGVANRIGMHLEFGGDGADCPMLRVKVTPDAGTEFLVDHGSSLSTAMDRQNTSVWIEKAHAASTDAAVRLCWNWVTTR